MALPMDWLNYHHLLYFYMTAREGSVSRAADRLHLTHPTVSGQIRTLEIALGEKLLRKKGRGLEMTEIGRMVYRYADEIFALGRELMDTVKGRPTGQPARLVVGVADVVPKLIVRRLLEPALRAIPDLRLICRDDRSDRLIAQIASFEVDVVITDAPLPPGSPVRAFTHEIGECATAFFGAPKLAARFKKKFPASLADAPLLLPTANTQVRRNLDQWFDRHQIRPTVVGEFEDRALLKTFGMDGLGLFPAPTVIEEEVAKRYDTVRVGRLDEVRERFFVISPEKRLRNPAVVAILEEARKKLFH
jgi:LysR family transcriptional regulator, transcriptional activator of nhaA